MKKAAITRFIFTLVLLCFITSFALAADSSPQKDSYLATYMDLYDNPLSDEVLSQRQVQFAPQEADYGDVGIRFQEALYDGQWLYTSASVWSKDESQYLVMPGDAQLSDSISGVYGETARTDRRSFRMAAKEDHKQLLCVYVYINEFDQLGSYFLDHLQVEDNTTILMSGGQLAGGAKPAEVSWTVQIYEVDLDTGKYTKRHEQCYLMTIRPIQPYIEKHYRAMNADDLPFDSVVLAQSPLNTYILPQLKSIATSHAYSFSLLDESVQNLLLDGMDIDAFNNLPIEITLSILQLETGKNIDSVSLILVDAENVGE